MEYKTGLYKVKTRTGNFERLKVFYNEKKQLVYSLSSTPPRPIELINQDELEVLKPIHELDAVLHAKLHVTWQDRELDEFKLSATSTTRFRNILDDLPDVMKMLRDRLGYNKMQDKRYENK